MKKITIVLLMMIVAACGFQLRDHQFLDSNLTLSIIEYDGKRAPLVKDELQKIFMARGVSYNSPESDYIVVLHGERYSSNALASNEYGRDREYTHQYEMWAEVFDRNNRPVMELSRFSKVRNFSHAESDLLGKSVGESNLKQELVKEVTVQFIRSLNLLLANQETARSAREQTIR